MGKMAQAKQETTRKLEVTEFEMKRHVKGEKTTGPAFVKATGSYMSNGSVHCMILGCAA